MDRIEYEKQQIIQDRLINKFVYWWAYNAIQPNLVRKAMTKIYAGLLRISLDKYGKIWDISYDYWKNQQLNSQDKVV
jgi:hypothetical protein